MRVLVLVESFVKDNASSIIGLISTCIIIMISYKLNVIIQKSCNNNTYSASSTSTSTSTSTTRRIEGGEVSKTCDNNNNNNNNIKCKNRKICCCGYSYNTNFESIDNIHMLLTSELHDMLITGYILMNSYNLNFCISSDIISLICLYCNNNSFFYTQIFIIKGSHKGRDPSLNKVECINLNYKTSYNINIYNINDIEDIEYNDDERIHLPPLSTIDRNWDTEENGICFVPNINIHELIPNDIMDKIDKMYQYTSDNNIYFDNNNNNTINSIFKCAGMTALGSNLSLNSNASMIIFKEDAFKNRESKDDIIGFEINLPKLPRSQTYCAQTVYSSKYGLITNCRDRMHLFDIKKYVINCNEKGEDDDDEEMEQDEIYWNKLCQMKTRRNWASSLCTIDNDNKLFICSGDGATTKTAEIYSFCDNKWMYIANMNDSFLMQSGIYYDSVLQRVYIGGGYKTEHKITYFDIYKNQWLDLPDTTYEHSEYPSIWCNNHHFVTNNILYIVGNSRSDLGVLEYIDLRITKKWNLVSNHMQLNQYIETPQLFKHNNCTKMKNHHRNQSDHYPMQIRRTFV